MRIKGRKAVLVEWEDSALYHGPYDENDEHTYSLLRVWQIGFLIRKDRETISLSSDVNEEERAREIITIARRDIVSITELDRRSKEG